MENDQEGKIESDFRKKKFVFIWPLNKSKIGYLNPNIFQYNQVEKLKYFSTYFSKYYDFEYFNYPDFEEGMPLIDFDNDIVFCHAPTKIESNLTKIGLKNYLELMTKSKRLYFMHPGAISDYQPTQLEKEIIQQCTHFLCWCGKYWYDRLLISEEPNSIKPLVGIQNISRLQPAIAADKIEFRPVFKPNYLSFLHVSNLSPIKAPHLLLLSLPKNQSNLYIASEKFANTAKTFKINYLDANGEEAFVSFTYPEIKAFSGTTHELKSTVGIGELVEEVSFYAMGYIKNWEPSYNQFIENEINYYLHLSINEGLSSSVLEAAARGILPCINVESGFLSPSVCYLTNDLMKNREILGSLASISEQEYLQRVTNLRDFVLSEHNWQKTLETLHSIINNS